MPKSSKTMNAMENMTKSAQSMFNAMPAAGTQGAHFWQAQDMILNEFEKFTFAWFRRRHEGTRTAIETSRQLAAEAMTNPAAAMGILTDWQSHSIERMAEDAKDCSEMVTKCTGALVSNEVEAIEETVEIAQKAVKPAKMEPA